MPTQRLPGRKYMGVREVLWRQTKKHLRAPSPIHHHSHTTGHLNTLSVLLSKLIGSHKGLPGPLWKLCTFGLMTHPLTGTWGNTTYPTYGMRYYRTPHHCGSSKATSPPLKRPPLYHTICKGAYKFLTLQVWSHVGAFFHLQYSPNSLYSPTPPFKLCHLW